VLLKIKYLGMVGKVPAVRIEVRIGMCVMALKTLANIGLSLLLVMTLLWGGCLSCPQYFMFPNSHDGCCNPAGHCKQDPAHRPASKDCNIQPIALETGAIDMAAHPALPIAIIPVALLTADASVHGAPLLEFLPSHESPPDFSLLHSVFRI
jgi:hypothetical protein